MTPIFFILTVLLTTCNSLPVIQEKTLSIRVEDVPDGIVAATNKKVAAIQEAVLANSEAINGLVDTASVRLYEGLNSVGEVFNTGLNVASERVAPVVNGASKSLAPVIAAASERLNPLIAAASETLMPVIVAANERLTPVIAAANERLTPVIAAASEQLSPVIAAASERLTPIINDASEKLRPVIENLGKGFTAISTGTNRGIRSISDSVNDRVVAVASVVNDGIQAVGGLVNQGTTAVGNAATQLGQSVTDLVSQGSEVVAETAEENRSFLPTFQNPFEERPRKIESAIIEQEDPLSKVYSVKDNVQQVVRGIFMPEPVVDTILREEEKYGNDGERFAKVGKFLVGSTEGVLGFLSRAVDIPFKTTMSVTNIARDKLNNLGGKLLGI